MISGLARAVIMSSMLFILTGCIPLLLVGGAVGAGGVKYYKDTVHIDLNKNVFQAHNAAIRALEQFQIKISEQKVDEFSSKIRGKFADDDELFIDMKSNIGGKSHIKVRVGLLGDRNRSERIAQEIINNL